MKTLIKVLTIIIILTTNAYSEDNHKDHDHDNHDKDGFYGHLDVAIFADSMTKVANDGKYNEIYSHTHAEIGNRFSENFSINSNIKLEGGPDGNSHAHGGALTPDGDDHGINDHMLIFEELTLNYDTKKFSGYLGKFNPAVGLDYHNFPGMYGYQAIEEYGIKERVGLGGIIRKNAGSFGTHELNITSFAADTSGLSDSIFFERGHNSKQDSGVSNTENLSSYSASLSGSYPFSFKDNSFSKELIYRIGYADQAAGVSDATDNTRYSASLIYKNKISKDLSSKFIFERMQIDNLAGEDAHDRSHTTGGLGFEYQKWNFGTTYTYTDNDADEADESFNGNIFQSSVGYYLGSGVGLDFGYKSQDKDNKTTERIGVGIKFSSEF